MPFVNPTVPNVQDYLTFLYGTVGIPTAQLPSTSGVVSSATTTTVTDTTATWTVNEWAGYAFVDVTQGSADYVTSNTATVLTLTTALTTAPVAGDTYLVVPDIVFTSFSVAQDMVNDDLSAIPGSIYSLATYNLAADRLINFAPDQPNQTYFADIRTTFNINSVSVGVASSTNDQGTSVGILNPKVMEALTMFDLQTFKTPYGRAYMGFAQQYGPSLWGLT